MAGSKAVTRLYCTLHCANWITSKQQSIYCMQACTPYWHVIRDIHRHIHSASGHLFTKLASPICHLYFIHSHHLLEARCRVDGVNEWDQLVKQVYGEMLGMKFRGRSKSIGRSDSLSSNPLPSWLHTITSQDTASSP